MENLNIVIDNGAGVLPSPFVTQLSRKFNIHEGNNRIVADACSRDDQVHLVIYTSSGSRKMDGINHIRALRKKHELIPIILVSKYSSEDRIIAAFREGVNDYVRMPCSFGEISRSIERCVLNSSWVSGELRKLRRRQNETTAKMMGNSPEMQRIREFLGEVAITDSTVLITGESGTGKELAAEMIHHLSNRSDHPFICVNSAAIPESLVESELFGYDRGAFTGAEKNRQGLFEQAVGGSIFLDEISEMSLMTQAKILRLIENKKVMRVGGGVERDMDVRIIAATNRAPEELLGSDSFRSDLYYRLNVACIHMPPLRKRREDLPLLLNHFIGTLSRNSGRKMIRFSPKAWASLLQYDWPGNVRELKNLVESIFITLKSDQIEYCNLPVMFRRRYEQMNREYASERDKVLNALFATNWNKSQAAEKLNWSRMTLYRKIEQHSIVENRPIRSWPIIDGGV